MMRILVRVLAVAAGLVVIVVVAALLYLTFGDLSRFEPRIEAAVSDSLGREFRIDGDLDIEILPHPSISADNLYLANAEWGSPDPLVAIGHVAAEIDLWSVFSGPIIVEQLEISDAAVLIEENESGGTNYEFETLNDEDADADAEPAAEGGSTEAPVTLEHAQIASLDIVLRRPGEEDFNVTIDSLDVVTSEDQVLTAVLAAQVQDLTVGLDASLDPAGAVQTGGPVAYRLQAMLDDAEVTVAGDLDSLFAAQPASVDDGVVRQHVRFDGSIASLSLLGAVFEIENLPELEMTLAGDLEFGAGGIGVDPLDIAIGDSDFAGSVSAEFGESVAVVLEGQSAKLDLTPFFPPAPETSDAANEAEPEQTDSEPVASVEDVEDSEVDSGGDATASGALLFPDEPLPLEVLDALDLQVDLTVAELLLQTMVITDLEIALENTDGRAALMTRFNGTEGGSAEGEVTLDASAQDSAELDIDFAFNDVRLNVMSGEIDDPSQIPPIALGLDLSAAGRTPHALASSANGRIVLTQGTGLIENNAVGLVSGDIIAQLFSALNPFAEDEEFTELQCTAVALNLTDGNGVLDPVLVETAKLQIIGGGEIDFETEQLNIEFNTKPRTGVGITADMFVTPFVKLSGTLAEPGIGLNASGALLQGGAAVLTGGASLLLGGLADRATAQAGQCESTLAALAAPAEPAGESTDESADEPENAAAEP